MSTIIKNIKNSSPGWDNIPPVLLKSCITSYIKPLTYIVNKSFETSVLTFFSNSFEKANIY